MTKSPQLTAREETAAIGRLRALIIPGTPDEQRRRRLVVLENIRRGYAAHRGGEPQWLAALQGRVERGESLERPQSRTPVAANHSGSGLRS